MWPLEHAFPLALELHKRNVPTTSAICVFFVGKSEGMFLGAGLEMCVAIMSTFGCRCVYVCVNVCNTTKLSVNTFAKDQLWYEQPCKLYTNIARTNRTQFVSG